MSHFAQVKNGIVQRVIVAEQDFIDSGKVGDPATWLQTSYNTRGGKHPQGRPLRFNYAGIGHKYDKARDAFIPPRPFKSWLLDEKTCLWQAPVPMPTDGKMYAWDELVQNWVEQKGML